MLGLLKNCLERVRERGWRRTATYAWYRLEDAAALSRFGILSAMRETMVNIPKDQLGFDSPDCHSHHPSESYHVFGAVMKRFVQPHQDDVFVDYGSGLGRVLLMAATFPFRRIIGVEYSEELNANAVRIIEQAKKRLKCQDIRCVTADAAQYDLPSDASVIYFFDPFSGDILERVIEKIRQSLAESPRKVRMIYYSPARFENLIHGCDWLVKKGEVVFPAVAEHAIAIYETR